MKTIVRCALADSSQQSGHFHVEQSFVAVTLIGSEFVVQMIFGRAASVGQRKRTDDIAQCFQNPRNGSAKIQKHTIIDSADWRLFAKTLIVAELVRPALIVKDVEILVQIRNHRRSVRADQKAGCGQGCLGVPWRAQNALCFGKYRVVAMRFG